MNKIIFLTTALTLVALSNCAEEISTTTTTTTTSTLKPRLNKAFNPKFVRILSPDEVKTSSDEKLSKKLKNKVGVGRYGARHTNSPIQMIYKVEDVPLDKVKPFVPSEPMYVGPKLRPADGAYPVYYGGAYTNGKFGKAIKWYTLREFRQLFKS